MKRRPARSVASVEENLHPCGDAIIGDHTGIRDERGHPVGYYHEYAVALGVERVAGILALHRTDPEGIVPTCIECGKVAPCPTRGIATGLIE